MEENQANTNISTNSLSRKPQLFKYIAIVLFILLPLTGFYLGMQYQKTNQAAGRIPGNSNASVTITPTTTTNETGGCEKNFKSTIAKFSFSYDSCDWNVVENLEEQEIILTNKEYSDTAQNVTIYLANLGAGGGYPNCAEKYKEIQPNFIRVMNNLEDKSIESYEYLTEAHAVRFNSDEFGVVRPICWSGYYLSYVQKEGLTGKEEFQSDTEFGVSINASSSLNSKNKDSFFNSADTFVSDLISKL